VGRREDCDVVVQHPGVSKRHCVLVKTDGLLVIRDLATTNGTKVKGQRVRWAALLPDDRISLGGYKMRVYLGADDMLSPSEQRRGGQRQGQGADWDTSFGDTGLGAGTTRPAGAQTTQRGRPTEKTFAPPSDPAVAALAGSDQTAAPAAGGEYFEIVEDEDEIIELG
jgi:pSer/pThr/pTyr-binding forkhead associated (FHA) protein